MDADFATAAITLYVAHHVGDYWVQTDAQARRKGDAGGAGRLYCLGHVLSYLATQAWALAVVHLILGMSVPLGPLLAALAISGLTHYTADRREHGLMFWLASRMRGKANFLRLGVPRPGRDDNPSLGTGSWALDQSWHLLLSVFVPALVLAA